MRIGVIAPYIFKVPPDNYGGVERVVSWLVEELVKRGHDITLFAPQGSATRAKLISPVESRLLKGIESTNDPAFHIINTYVSSVAFSMSNEFDIIHSHSIPHSMPFAESSKTPNVNTIHNIHYVNRPAELEMLKRFRHQNFIAVSMKLQQIYDLNYLGYIYNGLLLNEYEFDRAGGEYIVWAGALNRDKGEVIAAQTVKLLKKQIRLAYFDPDDTLDDFLTRSGLEPNYPDLLPNANHKEMSLLFRKAKVSLLPFMREEPFGLTMIESMAAGTPVIAYARGAVPEIIRDGKTGYIVNQSKDHIVGQWKIKQTGIAGLLEALNLIYNMPLEDYQKMRLNCRERVEQFFTAGKMADAYESIYKKVIEMSYEQ